MSLLLFLTSAPVWAAGGSSLTGTILDGSGAVVAGARATLLTAGQTVVASTESDSQGRYRFDGLPAGTYSLSVAKQAFSSQRLAVTVRVDGPTEVTVRLEVQPIAAHVTVTAETGRVEMLDAVAQRVNAISHDEIEQRADTVLVDAFLEEPGVDVQRTVPVMGGVAVRGLLGKNVAVYRDGVRYTSSAQRGGVSTFFNLNEPTNLDGIEILRGPNSAQYGSDSLGGTVHLLSRVAPLGSSVGWHGEIAPLFSSAANAFGGNLLTSYGAERFGVLFNLASRRVNTLRSAGGLDSHAAVTRYLGLPSSVLGERSTDTAFTQYGGMFHGQLAPTPKQQIVGHYERSQQDGGKRWDQLLGGDGNLIADLRNLMLDFGYLRYTHFEPGPFDRAAVTFSYNSQREERVNQGGSGNPLGAITHQYERTTAWGTNFFLTKRVQRQDLLVGGDGYRETERAPAFTVNPVSGTSVASRPRVPDGARYLLYGLYAQDVWEPWKNGRLRFSGALRFGGASYQSRASYSPLVSGAPLWPDDSAAANSLSGRLGVVWRVAAPVRVHFNYSRGFRAPGMTDLGTVGLQGNGAYEASYADLSTRGALIGDRADDRAVSSGRPVARVQSETSDNYDGGLQISTSRVRAEVTGFWINLNNTIVSQTLILPAGATGQQLGDQTITRQLPTGAVFVPASSSPVLVRGNLGGAQVYGVEHLLEVKLRRSLSFTENATWIYARDTKTGLPPDIEGGTPPLSAHLRLRWAPSGKRYWAETYSTLAGRQDRLSSLALSDRRTGAPRSRSNIASFFNNGARVRGLVANGILLPTGETLTQVQDRVLGSASSAPLFTAIPGYALFGVRGGLQLAERSSLWIDFSNMFDQRHRGISWGTDGAGRAVTLSYRYKF